MDSDPTFVKEIEAKALKGDEACRVAAGCLQAMRSVICANLAAPSATAYFAAAVAALQKQGEVKGGGTATASALLLVLRKAIPAAPASAVCARFNDVVAAVAGVLRTPEDDGLVRQALGCLMAASDAAYGAGSRPNRKVLKPVFQFLDDARVPVRHQAEITATLIIKRAAASADQLTLEFAVQHLGQMLAAGRPDKKAQQDALLPAQRALALLRAVAPALPVPVVGSLCEAMLKLPGQLGQHPCCIEAFEFLAEYLAADAERDQRALLSAALLPTLLGVPVTMLNVMYVAAYAKALATCVAALSEERALAAVPTARPEVPAQKVAAVRKALSLFAERDPTVLRAAREACVLIFSAAGQGGDLSLLEELPGLCQPVMGYEAKGAWRHVLPAVTAAFEALDAIRTARVGPAEVAAWTAARFARARGLVEQLVLARDKARGGELNVFGDELSACLSAAVVALGPDKVLEVAELRLLEVPLSDPAYEQLARSWLLLVLRGSCRRSSLAFFASRFLPLATGLKGKALEAESAKHGVHAKKYATLLEQVWALLPTFCDEPLDLGPALLADGGRLAKQLVAVLQGEKDLRDYVWAGLAKACDITREPPSPLSTALQASNRAALQTLAGRVLPEMFGAFLKVHAELEGQDASRISYSRGLALGAVQAYVRVAEPALVGDLFKKLVARLLKATTATPDGQDTGASPDRAQALPIADLASALVPHLAPELLDLTLRVFSPMLSGAGMESEEDKALGQSLQKSAYKAVTGVIKHPAVDAPSAGGLADGSGRILGLWGALRDARQTCVPGALKARLVALESMLRLTERHLQPRFKDPAVRQEYLECLTSVMPEILFHLRDQSTAVRDAARECLHVAATTAIHQELQAEIIALISAGLAGLTRHSKASAVDALSRLMYEHSSKFSEALQDRLICIVLLLLEDTDAQVWRAALKFAKVVVYVVPRLRLEKLLPDILRLFKGRHLASAKMMVRNIIERLTKVIPTEVLTEAFPEDHLPLLHYVQRQVARQQRPKGVRAAKPEDGEGDEDGGKAAAGKGGGEEDDEEDDDEMGGAAEARPTWDAFQAKGEKEPAGTAAEGAGRKRVRVAGGGEPPTSAVMAHEAVQALLDAWEEESGSDGEEGAGRRPRRPSRGKRKREAGGEATTWIHEDREVPLDFMSADAAHSVLTVRPAPAKRRRAAEVGPAGAQSRVEALRRSGLRFAEDGRLVVAEEEEKPEEKKSGFNLGTNTDAKKVKPLSRLAAQRRARAEAKAKARVERRGVHTIKGLENYKPGAKGAQGDARRKGVALDPYAYVKLNPKVAKEKYRDKATQSFAKVVKGAKQGVLKGKKAKARDQKLRKSKEVREKRRKLAGKGKAARRTHAR